MTRTVLLPVPLVNEGRQHRYLGVNRKNKNSTNSPGNSVKVDSINQQTG
jgi:hypothetical protein